MQYMLLAYETRHWAELPEAEKNRIQTACGEWHQELVKSGHARVAVGLHPASTAVTVRDRHGKPLVTDGPFAETKEVLGGFEIIECKDLDEAIAIAGRFPGLRNGISVEVREVHQVRE